MLIEAIFHSLGENEIYNLVIWSKDENGELHLLKIDG